MKTLSGALHAGANLYPPPSRTWARGVGDYLGVITLESDDLPG